MDSGQFAVIDERSRLYLCLATEFHPCEARTDPTKPTSFDFHTAKPLKPKTEPLPHAPPILPIHKRFVVSIIPTTVYPSTKPPVIIAAAKKYPHWKSRVAEWDPELDELTKLSLDYKCSKNGTLLKRKVRTAIKFYLMQTGIQYDQVRKSTLIFDRTSIRDYCHLGP